MTTCKRNTVAVRTRDLGLMLLSAGYLTLVNVPAPAQTMRTDETLTHAVAQGIIGVPPINQPGTIPSGIIPTACKQLQRGDSLLDCYLNDSSNQQIAGAIS